MSKPSPARYRTTNWSSYNAALRKRGSLLIWLVTAERIRDKVRASRMKGMWMGGMPSYGYRVEYRKLVVDDEHAEHVRWIFARFLEIGSCTELAREVAKRGIRTPRGNRIDKKYLYRMLNNRV